MVEDVRLDKLPILHTLNGECVTSMCIHQQQFGHLSHVQMPEVLHELVIEGVQFLTQFLVVLFVVVCLVGVERFIGVTQWDVCRQPCRL